MTSTGIKTLVILMCCIAVSNAAMAQKDSLATDEQGRYIYYKVADADGYRADTLYHRALHLFNVMVRNKELKVTSQDATGHSIAATGFFVVSKPSLGKHPTGQITYQLKLEIKGFKYRYWLTGFVYTPYHRDRYTSYVPDDGVELPLEKASAKLSQKDIDHYLDDCARFSIQLGQSLKARLLQTAAIKKDTSKKVIHIGNW